MSDASGVPAYKFRQFDYDVPITEWPEEDVEEFLDLLGQAEFKISEVVRKYNWVVRSQPTAHE